MSDQRYPLSWPAGWPRTRSPQASRFDRSGDRTFAVARDELLRQLRLLGATHVVLSTNIPLRQDGLPYSNRKQPDDRGVAVYFQLNKKPMTLACDAWNQVDDNVWAIAKHIDALRGQQRWGVGSLEQAFMGYQSLPDADRERPWWEVFGLSQYATWEEVKAAYRDDVKLHHPDVGGDRQRWDELQRAYEQAEQALKKGANI